MTTVSTCLTTPARMSSGLGTRSGRTGFRIRTHTSVRRMSFEPALRTEQLRAFLPRCQQQGG